MKKTTAKYGAVYTPRLLADFLAELIQKFYTNRRTKFEVLDPACGEFSLLKSIGNFLPKAELRGIDVDEDILSVGHKNIDVNIDDFILPKGKQKEQPTAEYWLNKGLKSSIIVANPPWSSDRIYNPDELDKSGFMFIHGQYDSYVLFIELALKLLTKGGYLGLIIPDSFFADQNIELRKYLLTNYQIKIVARLGEKIFKNVNRATTILVIRNQKPNEKDLTTCFRLNPDVRKKVLSGQNDLINIYDKFSFNKPQVNFMVGKDYHISVDTSQKEDRILSKIRTNAANWNGFEYMRGVEISKSGIVVTCPFCGNSQGFSPKSKKKKCMFCHKEFELKENRINKIISEKPKTGWQGIIVGESLHRYDIKLTNWIEPNVKGIKYKDTLFYYQPKILVRKTGLGIYAAIDNSGAFISQTVHMLYRTTSNDPLEYYLALLNSRVIYYYYLKVWGQTEWKSHPYITKHILMSLPIKKYMGTKLDRYIVKIAKKLQSGYNKELDILLETLVMDAYQLNIEDRETIITEINGLPDLDSINQMKIGD